MGGECSGDTVIKHNRIEESQSEGIFIVEGGEKLLIQMNHLEKNKKGMVLLHSDGVIDSNKIVDNEIGL